MRSVLVLSVLIMLFTTNTNAQMLADPQRSSAEFTSYSPPNPTAKNHERAQARGLVCAGAVTMGVGGFGVLFGAITCYGAYTRNYIGSQEVIDQGVLHTGHVMEAAGGIVAVGGLVMLVAGGTRLSAIRNAKVTLIAPKNNEMGFAYNF